MAAQKKKTTSKKAVAKKRVNKKASSSNSRGPSKGTTKISTGELPRKSLQECLSITKPIHEIYAGNSATWDEISTSLKIGPRSPATKYLFWGAQAYDLVIKDGDRYALTETARRILEPTSDTERTEAIRKAVLIPTIFSRFYTDYNGKLIPDSEFFVNVIQTNYGVPKGRASEAIDLIIANAEFAGILTEHDNGKRTIRLDSDFTRIRSEDSIAPLVSENALPSSDSLTPNSKEEIPSQKATIKTKPGKTCFYITPIGSENSEERRHTDMLLTHLVEPAFLEFDIEVVRADKITEPGIINRQIFDYIVQSKYCIADLSFNNPNAFYELGVRHMMKLPTIQIIRKGDKIPFDVSQGRTIIVDLSDIYSVMDKIDSARRELVDHIKSFATSGDGKRAEDNPISIYLPNLSVVTTK